MVRFLLFFLFAAAEIFASDVTVKAELGLYQIYEHEPIRGSVVITHSADEKVDESSFVLEGAPLDVELEREVKVSKDSSSMISIYRFKIEPKVAGEHTLSPISLKIGGRDYSTALVPFTVSTLSQQVEFEEPILKLEENIDARLPLYPKQRFKVVYRYIYRGNIQMTFEKLPLLTGAGFKKIGEPKIRDFIEGDKSVREITLELEAIDPGKFTFEPAVIEGKAYLSGRPQQAIQAKTEAVEITVLPFPKGAMPQGFDGLYGDFKIQAELLSYAKVVAGDRLTLKVTISGKDEDLTHVKLPNIFCLPGFSGMFAADDLGGLGKMEKGQKIFTVYLRPLHEGVFEIPPIILTFFNPERGQYDKVETAPIPIQVSSLSPVELERSYQTILKQTKSPDEDWQANLSALLPPVVSIDDQITETDIRGRAFANWFALLVFPLVAVLIFVRERL